MPIELERTQELQKLQKDTGDTCVHHNYEKEYFNGIFTGDYACTCCGHSVSVSEYQAFFSENH